MIPIHDIQYTQDPSGNSPYSGQTVSTGGIVTAINYTGQSLRYFIADRDGGLWSGIFVYDTQDRHVAAGDSVSFQAEVQESNTQTRLRNIVSGTFAVVPGSGSVPPVLTTCAEVVEATEGVLIELQNVVVTVIGTGQFTVTDGTGQVSVGNGWSYAYVPMLGDTLRFVRGIVTSASYVFTLNPRGDADFSFTGNRPPLISNVQNSPITPTELQSDTVSAAITDEQGVQSATIYYRFSTSGDLLPRPMYDNGQNGDVAAGDGRWTGVVPAGPARGTCYYYITATDS
ncbi:hypothetical protein EHM69_05410, partial [candidate division KSB1 bacterium]